MTRADDLPRDPSPAEPRNWAVVVGTAGGVFLGLVLLVGLYAKAIAPHGFEEVISSQGLDFLLPARGVAFLGLAIEGLLGFALLLFVRRRIVLWPTAVLVVFFLCLTGRHYYLHAHGLVADDESCGCFGDLIQRSPGEAFWGDLVLMLPALLLSFLGRPSEDAPLPWRRLAVVGGLTVGVLLYAAGVPRPPPVLREGVGVASVCFGEGEDDPGRLCLDAVIPELIEGDHVVVMAELADPRFLAHLEALNGYAEAMEGPLLWVLTPAGDEQVDTFKFEQQPVVEVLGAPAPFVELLYDTLPRSFRVRDGSVTVIWNGWPPLEEISSEGSEPDDSEPGDDEDSDGSDPDDSDPDDSDPDDQRGPEDDRPRKGDGK